MAALLGRAPWPELLEDLGARGLSTLFVEGGATVAASVLASDLVDQISLFQGPAELGDSAIPSPVTLAGLAADDGWTHISSNKYGDDACHTFERRRKSKS